MFLLEEDDIQTTFSKTDWKAKYEEADDEYELSELADEFIDSFLKDNNLTPNIGFRNALKEQLLTYGENAFDPNFIFLEWIKHYDKATDGLLRLRDEGYNNLISAYANNIVLDEDLNATSYLKSKNIIFVENLFEYELNNFLYLVKCFYYLNSKDGSKEFLGEYNSLSDDQKNEFFIKLGYTSANAMKKEIDASSIKNIILFEKAVFDNKGRLRNPRNISDALSYLDNTAPKADSKRSPEQSENVIDSDLAKKIEDAKSGLVNQGKNKKYVDDILNIVVKTGKINKDTSLSDIIKYALNIMAGVEGKVK